MSVNRLLHQAAAGAGGGSVYVDDVFSTFLYDGNRSTQTITNDIDLSGEGGLVWLKGRDASGGTNHRMYDTVRGANKSIVPNSNAAETTHTDQLTSFNSNGFSIGASADINWDTQPFGTEWASWSFRKQSGFFDVVTYTGTGNTTGGSPQWREISHNLGTAPGMIIVKKTSGTGDWYVWHRGLPDDSVYAAQSGFLNQTANFGGYNGFQTAANQTAAHFSLRQNSSGQTNDSGATYVAYLFAHDAQDFGTDSDEAIIKCDTYTGNGSSTGPTVNLGFEPQFLLIKSASSGDAWGLFDSMRGISSNNNDAYLQAQASDQEYDNQAWVDLTATGFQLKNSHDFVNGNGNTYIYMAIRRPHKPASEFAATDLFTPLANPGNSSAPYWTASHVIDTWWQKNTTSGGWYVGDRLRQGRELQLDINAAEGGASNHVFDYQTGASAGASGSNAFRYLFRRAKGFFDVVTYVGDGTTSHAVNHNLGVAPELIIVKDRTRQANWSVYHQNSPVSGSGKRYNIILQADNAAGDSDYWPSAPTSTQFVLGDSDQGINRNGDAYIAYLFATADGISKVGGYTGTGSDLNVDCGFSAGARFVLIKRTDSSGDWYVYDSVRGIVAGNDPYYFINSNAAQVTNTDYIDPLSSGFTVTSSAPAGLNASGGNYIFLAIA